MIYFANFQGKIDPKQISNVKLIFGDNFFGVNLTTKPLSICLITDLSNKMKGRSPKLDGIWGDACGSSALSCLAF